VKQPVKSLRVFFIEEVVYITDYSIFSRQKTVKMENAQNCFQGISSSDWLACRHWVLRLQYFSC